MNVPYAHSNLVFINSIQISTMFNPPLPPTTLTGVKRQPPLPPIITLSDSDDEDLFGDSDDDEDLFPRKTQPRKKPKMQGPVIKEGEDVIAFYDRAIAYYRKAVNLKEMNRMYDCKGAYMRSEILVQRLRLGLVKQTKVYTADELHEKVKNARKMAMFYSCSRAFAKLEHCCNLHETLHPVELDKYIFELEGWTSKDDWDKEVKKRKELMDERMKTLYPDKQCLWKGNSWLGH